MNKLILQQNEHGNTDSSFDYFIKFNIPKNAKILDIGCRYGSLIYNLYTQGYNEIYGIDIDRDTIKKGKESYTEISERINEYDGQKIPFEGEFFDVVLMFDVIEHIPSIEKFLKEEARRVLRKGGILIFQTPSKYINVPWEIIQQKSFTKWKKYHCSLQTIWSLRKLFKKLGFNFINIEKNNILTEHNKIKVRRKIGEIGIILLYILQRFPLTFYPNLWGSARK